jgi:tripartite-type tricarboxylate transporter receptor subunit TctC
VLAPSRTPLGVIAQFNAALLQVLRHPELRHTRLLQGAEVVHGTPEQFGVLVRADIAKCDRVSKVSGTTVD